jgi:ABC-2 type transport system ATP-binding protein
MTTAAIEVNGLSKSYGAAVALRDLSFRVEPGALFGIIGADGAGKTTCMKILATLLTPDAGTATVLGHDVVKGYSRIRAMIGYMPQRFSLYEDLSVIENISFFADLFGVKGEERRRRVARLLGFSRLGPFADRRARNLSGGMKQKLALCCALIHTPELLVLDEPTTGVDPLSRREFWAILHDLNSQGMTVVVSTPYMNEAEYCARLLLMHKGGVLRSGTPAEMVASYPLSLVRVSSSTAALHVPHGRSVLAGGARLYPVAGALHVAFPPRDSLDESALLREVRALDPAADMVERITPGVEDILFHCIGEADMPEAGHG